MSGIHTDGRGNGAIRHPHRNPVARRAARWLGLAAMPAFAIMALLTGISDGDAAGLICSSAHGGASLGGMASMYLLMAVFHSVPWLKLVPRRPTAPIPQSRRPSSNDGETA
jgi:hypothetical protein